MQKTNLIGAVGLSYREIPWTGFERRPMTVIAADEILTEIRVPVCTRRFGKRLSQGSTAGIGLCHRRRGGFAARRWQGKLRRGRHRRNRLERQTVSGSDDGKSIAQE